MKDLAVVYKYSALESYSPKQIRRHRELNPELSHRMQSAHDDHSSAFERLRAILDGLKLSATYFERDTLRQSLDNFRLVISLGGDGTFINASHFIEKTVLLGVNSSPENSVGHYCRFDLKNLKSAELLKRQIAAFFTGKASMLRETKLLRMQIMLPAGSRQPIGQRLHERAVAFPVLNDALFCEENPAATSRYTLKYKGINHHQKSSGLWVSTPTGSTAAYASAGGKEFKQKQLRFIVRELYSDDGRRLTQGKIALGEKLQIISSMMHGALYLDGSHHKVPVALGEHITISAHPQALRAIY